MSERANVMQLVDLETRESAAVWSHHVAAAIELKSGGTRILFAAGGHIDVCGTQPVVWRTIELARMGASE